MGLLDDIWAMIRGKIEWLIHAIVDPLVNRINEGIKQISDWVTGIESAWDNFTTKTLPDLWKAIREASDNFVTYVENTYNYITQEIHNVYNTTEQYITNVIGASEEWVQNYAGPTIKQVGDLFRDPAFIALTRDPWEFVEIMADRHLNRYMQDAAKSFTEGLMEELRGPEG